MDPFVQSLLAISVTVIIGFFLVKLLEKMTSKPAKQVRTEEPHATVEHKKA